MPPRPCFPGSPGLQNPCLTFQSQLIYSLPCLLLSPTPEDKERRVCPLG